MTNNPYVSSEMRALWDYECSKRLETLRVKSMEGKVYENGLIGPGVTWEDHLEAESLLDRLEG